MYWFYVGLLGPLARLWFTPTIKGLENVPKEGPAIIASNHLAAIDDAIIPLVTPRMVHFMGKAEYFTGKGIKGKLKKFFFTTAGVFPVDRSGGTKALGALESAREILEDGKLFGIHPEGTRSPDGNLYRGHTGVARLAFETGAPIIPVALTGTDKAQPTGKVFPQRHHCTITYGEPIVVEKKPADQLTHEEIRDLTDTMMAKIGEMSGQKYIDMYAQVKKKQLKEARAQAEAQQQSPVE
ncbi:MAG: 1-acyl-sn-glycerol-3-phosphate acyltransferase [Bifidobacteriaceae bacterium]|nr:1-acyl-sn-glycerol-3-phosphate acyltransferase [Bifidobacteriaceae bacterium]MCI1978799.1 1-acyl-sn-glycerol-3-phosphate acyltransferase [Bifidobacteriaceae bacterium]